MSLNPYVPYDSFNVSLVEKLSWICRKYRLYHEIHQDKTFKTTPFWSHLLYRVGWSDPWSDDPDYLPVCLWNMPDDLAPRQMIRATLDRPAWPVWQTGLAQSSSRCCECEENTYQRYIDLYSHLWHNFGYIQSDSKQLKHNFNYWILFVCLTKFVSKLAMFLIEPSALQSRYSKSWALLKGGAYSQICVNLGLTIPSSEFVVSWKRIRKSSQYLSMLWYAKGKEW